VVPKIVVGGGASGSGGAGGSSLLESLLAVLLSEKLGALPAGPAAIDGAGAAYRDRIRAEVTGGVK